MSLPPGSVGMGWNERLQNRSLRRRTLRHRRARSSVDGFMSHLILHDVSVTPVHSSRKPLEITSSVSVETTEVSLETERTSDDLLNLSAKRNSGIAPVAACEVTTAQQRRGAAFVALKNTQRALKALQSIKAESLASCSSFGAVVAGMCLPSSWIIYGAMYGFLLAAIGALVSIWSKWMIFYWDDSEMVRFRRTISGLVRLCSKELEATVDGSYSRQVMASYLWYASTAPGESFFTAYIRYQTSHLNSRIIEEIEKRNDRVYKYKKESRKFFPFG